MEWEVGEGATEVCWSDRKAYTVIEVKKNSVVIQRDNTKLMNAPDSGQPDALQVDIGGFGGHVSGKQRYEYSRNPNGITKVFSRRKNGQFVQKGEPLRGGTRIEKGRNEFYDFNF